MKLKLSSKNPASKNISPINIISVFGFGKFPSFPKNG
jgi:hypothetical protein